MRYHVLCSCMMSMWMCESGCLGVWICVALSNLVKYRKILLFAAPIEWNSCSGKIVFVWMKQMNGTDMLDVCRWSYGRSATHRIVSHCTYNQNIVHQVRSNWIRMRFHTAFGRIRFIHWSWRESFHPFHTRLSHFNSIEFHMWPTSVRVRCSYRTDRFSFFLCSVHFCY